MKQPIKMTPGDELHLTALMAPFSLNLVTGQDRQHLLGYGRAAFEAGQAGQCLHQIQEPAAAEQAAWHAGLDEGRAQAAPAAVAVPDGLKLVPVDLTPEMKREFMDLLMDGIDIYVNRRDQIEIQTDAPRRIWKAVLALAPSAPADALATATGLPAQAVPSFCHVASLKLKSLQERGYQITGYALEKPVEGAQPERGFINHGGFVGWWWDGQTPQAQADARDADGMYYLQNARWSAMVGNCPSFWRSGGGYTTSLDDAERFTLEAAMKQHKCRETDLPWLCAELDKLRRPTVDCQYMPRSWDAQRAAIAAQASAKEGSQG